MNSRGEMSTQQIIMMIILITSFIIVLFFLFRLNLGEDSQSEICHNSVVSGHLTPDLDSSLVCYRKYICITEDGTCEKIVDPIKEKVDSLEDIYYILSEDMANCWWMFGEGKVDYVGEDILKDNYCSICSQIYFDDSLNNIEGIDGEISKDQLYNYMANNNLSFTKRKETYSEYLFGTNNIEQLKKNLLGSTNESLQAGTFGTIVVGDLYFDTMGIISEVSTWKNAAVVGGVGIIALPFLIGGGVIAAVVGGVGGAVVGGLVLKEATDLINPEILAVTVKGNGIDNVFMSPTIIETDPAKFDQLNCYEILTYT